MAKRKNYRAKKSAIYKQDLASCLKHVATEHRKRKQDLADCFRHVASDEEYVPAPKYALANGVPLDFPEGHMVARESLAWAMVKAGHIKTPEQLAEEAMRQHREDVERACRDVLNEEIGPYREEERRAFMEAAWDSDEFKDEDTWWR